MQLQKFFHNVVADAVHHRILHCLVKGPARLYTRLYGMHEQAVIVQTFASGYDLRRFFIVDVVYINFQLQCRIFLLHFVGFG